MYNTVIFPNINRTDANPEMCRASPKSMKYLDIQAILFRDIDRPRIGVLDMASPEGLRTDERSEEIAPHVSFKPREIEHGKALEKLYNAMKENPSFVSSRPFLWGNVEASESSSHDFRLITTGVSAAFSVQPWNTVCIFASRSSQGFIGFTAISRKPKGLSIERLSLHETGHDQSFRAQHAFLQGDLCFADRWSCTTRDNKVCASWQEHVAATCEAKNANCHPLKFTIPMLISSQDSAILYVLEVFPKGSPHANKKGKGAKDIRHTYIHSDFILVCRQITEFSCPSVVQSIHPSRFVARPEERSASTFLIGLSNGEAHECFIDQEKCSLEALNSSKASEEKKAGLMGMFSRKQKVEDKPLLFDPVVAILCMENPNLGRDLRVVCVIHATSVEWVIIYKPHTKTASDKKYVLQQDLNDKCGGYPLCMSIHMAASSDMGHSVTLLAQTCVCKVFIPSIEKIDDNEIPSGKEIFRVNDELAFRIIPHDLTVTLEHDWNQQIFRGLMPKYTFAKKIDEKMIAKAKAHRTSSSRTVLNSLYHALGEMSHLDGAVYKHVSSSFPTAIFSSPSHSRVFYLHFTSRSMKFEEEKEEIEGVSRIALNEVGTMHLDVPYCVIEYSDHAKVRDAQGMEHKRSEIPPEELQGMEPSTYSDANEDERVAYWAQRFRSDWVSAMSPHAFKSISPWSIIDLKVWEQECLPKIDVKIHTTAIKCFTVIRRDESLTHHRLIDRETPVSAEASVDILRRLHTEILERSIYVAPKSNIDVDPHYQYEKLVFMRSLDGKSCLYCGGAVARVYNVFYPTMLHYSGSCLKADVYYSIIIRCERSHLLSECAISGEIMADWVSDEGSTFQKCNECSSVFSVGPLKRSNEILCQYCSLPLV